jgi:hypothetical protein
MQDEQDVQATSSAPSAIEQAIASSPEVKEEAQQTQEAQTPPAEQGETQESEGQFEKKIGFNHPDHPEHGRFVQLHEENRWLKSQLEAQLQRSQQNQPPQPTHDPYANMTPEEERFWRAVDDRASKIADQKLQQVTPVIDAGRMELAQMKVANFRAAHTDIKADSPEEVAIAQRISSGYHPEDAYWSVMGPRGVRSAQQQVKQQVKQQMTAKSKANVESSAGIPSQAQAQQNPSKSSFRDDFIRNMRLAEEGKL